MIQVRTGDEVGEVGRADRGAFYSVGSAKPSGVWHRGHRAAQEEAVPAGPRGCWIVSSCLWRRRDRGGSRATSSEEPTGYSLQPSPRNELRLHTSF